MFLLPIVVGFAVGYGTNWLALKMLFWPSQPVFVGRWRVPLTPGLVIRRRAEFSRVVSELIEQRFVDAESIRQMFYKAQARGTIKSVFKSLGPAADIAFRLYAGKTTPESFARDCQQLADALDGVVSDAVRERIDDMPSEDIEGMLLTVVKTEMAAISYLGGVLGAVINVVSAIAASILT